MEMYIILSLAFVAAWLLYSTQRHRRGTEFPPGPPRLPIFGNILQLGKNPHKSLAQLAKTYGPLMSLKLGTQFIVVVSSPEMAREILQKQDLLFSKPFNPNSVRVHGHEHFSMAMLPATSDIFIKLRRIAKEELFSNKALESSEGLRRERLRKLVGHVRKYSDERRVINIGQAIFITMSNLIFLTLFSIEFIQYDAASDSVVHEKLKKHISAINKYMGLPNISDFFPIFAPLDPQGYRRKLDHHLGSLLEIVESMIEQRLEDRKASSTYQRKNDLLERLLNLMEGNEYDLSINEIKHLFVDLIIAGTETGATVIEWSMLELLLHPDKLAKLKAELKSVVGEKEIVEESDISRLPYLQAIIKEVLRYHPVSPLLAPHKAGNETRVNGYVIPKDTKIFVNSWAITRDPSVWKDPEHFEPERFLSNDIDFRGKHFELIPFGSGRKMCPGMPLANRMLHCVVATLCHNFDWEIPVENGSEKLQREEVFGLSLQKKTHLLAIPIQV